MGDVFQSETRVYSLTSVAGPSMYLRYHEESACDVIIQDVYVPEFSLAMCTYFCSMAWKGDRNGHGFCGIQNHVDGKSYIFSIWNSERDSCGSVAPVYTGSVTRTEHHHGAEKTGMKSMIFDLGWESDHWYTVAVRLWNHQGHTRLGFWVKEKECKPWTHAVTLEFTEHWADFDLIDSFFEDWGLNGDVTHHVKHRRGMKRSLDGSWCEFKSATFHVNEQYSMKNYSEELKTGIRTACLFFQRDSSRSTKDIAKERSAALQSFSDEILRTFEEPRSSARVLNSFEESGSSLMSSEKPPIFPTDSGTEGFGSPQGGLLGGLSCSLNERCRSCEKDNIMPYGLLGISLSNGRQRTSNNSSLFAKGDTGSFEELPSISDKRFWLHDEPESFPEEPTKSSLNLFKVSTKRNRSFQEMDTCIHKAVSLRKETNAFKQDSPGHDHLSEQFVNSQKRFAGFHDHISVTLPPQTAVRFTLESLTRSQLTWHIAEHETPQFKFTIKDGDRILASEVDSEARTCRVDLSVFSKITLIVEDILGRESYMDISTTQSHC